MQAHPEAEWTLQTFSSSCYYRVAPVPILIIIVTDVEPDDMVAVYAPAAFGPVSWKLCHGAASAFGRLVELHGIVVVGSMAMIQLLTGPAA